MAHKPFRCIFLGITEPKVQHMSYYEMASYSIQYPMALEVDGKWERIVHTKDGMASEKMNDQPTNIKENVYA